MFCVMCTTFSSINYHFRFSENQEIKKLKDERTILHKRATNLYLKKKLLKTENEKLKKMMKLIKDERTILHNRTTNLYLKKKLLKKENEELKKMMKLMLKE